MLRHANKLVLIIMSILVIGCLSEEEKLQRVRDNFAKNKVELQRQRQEIYKYTKNFTDSNLYDIAADSIKCWTQNNLDIYSYEKGNNWFVDSIVCLNTFKDKCVMALINQDTLVKEAISDGISYLYGVKIKYRWYFFRGAALVLPREYYQEDIHTPLSFETLKLIAVKEIFYNYLKKGKNGQYEINDKFFDGLNNYDAYGYPYTTQESWDNSWLKLCNQNWSRRNKD